MSRAPAPSPLAHAVCQGLTGAPPSGFSLIEVMLAMGGLALLSGAGFMIYQGAANGADVKTEQTNIQAIASNADRIQGALGSYAGMTTTAAIGQRIPPRSMVAGSGLVSRWGQPVLLEPTDVGTKPAAGLKITYEAVPARACAKLVQAAAGGMFGVQVADQSVMADGRLDTDAAISRCADGAPVAFTYYGGASGLAAMVLDPVNLPPLNPPTAPPPVAPPPAPPPAAPPPLPPAPGCGAAPSTAASGTTPPGQSCSFVWTTAPAPACWTPMALCSPIVAAPPPAPPPASPPPSSPPPPAPPGSTPACFPGASALTPQTQSANCLAGRSTPAGGATFTQNRVRTIAYTCPDPFGARVASPATYSPWSPTEASTCAPICSAPSPLTSTRAGPVASQTTPYSRPGPVASRPVSETRAGPVATKTTPDTDHPPCPSGQTGDWYRKRTGTQTSPTTQARTGTQTSPTTQTRTGTRTSPTTEARTTNYSCPAPTGAYTSTATPWADTGTRSWSAYAYTPWADTGARSWSTPSWGSWADTGTRSWSPMAWGAWATTSNTCAPIVSPCEWKYQLNLGMGIPDEFPPLTPAQIAASTKSIWDTPSWFACSDAIDKFNHHWASWPGGTAPAGDPMPACNTSTAGAVEYAGATNQNCDVMNHEPYLSYTQTKFTCTCP